MNEKPIDPYYLALGERLWTALVNVDVIAPDAQNETTKQAVVELFGGMLQESADSGARWRELQMRAEAIVAKRGKQ